MVKSSPASAEDLDLIPGSGRSPREGNGNALLVENPVDRRGWWATVQGVEKSWTQLSNWTTAAAAKSLQSCPTLCDPIDGSHQAPLSLGFSRQEHWSGLPFLSPVMKVKSESEVAQSCLTLSDPVDCSLPGSSIHGIFQAKYWSGVPLPSLEQQQLYWNYNLPQILILMRFLDNFHYYLASKLLEFIKFVSYYYYLLLLGCVLKISFLFFLWLWKT